MFADRADAARQLAQRLAHLKGQNPLILAVPRGGVPMGRILSDALDGDLDVVLVHKLGAPGNPELAIGAVGEDGSMELNEVGRLERLPEGYVEREKADQMALLKKRRKRYAEARPPIDPGGRLVVMVDDGAATGATLLAALRLVRAHGPARLIVALGVAPPDTVEQLNAVADEVVCLEQPWAFHAVGVWFRDFGQVEDDEVVALLKAVRRDSGLTAASR